MIAPAAQFVFEVTPSARLPAVERRALDEWLRSEVPFSLSEEYPEVFGEHAGAQSLRLLDGGRLAGHAAWLDVTADVYGRSVRVRLAGSVVIAPELRGRGFGRRLVAELVRIFERDEGVEVLLLWSEKRAFYAQAGLVPLGRERILTVAPAGCGGPSGSQVVRRAEPRDAASLLAIHHTKPIAVRRTPGFFARALSIPRAAVFVLERDGRPAAYAALGKGLDFPATIHETGGGVADVAELVRCLTALRGRPLDVLLRPDLDALGDHLPGARLREGILGLGRTKTALPADLYVEGFDSI